MRLMRLAICELDLDCESHDTADKHCPIPIMMNTNTNTQNPMTNANKLEYHTWTMNRWTTCITNLTKKKDEFSFLSFFIFLDSHSSFTGLHKGLSILRLCTIILLLVLSVHVHIQHYNIKHAL